MDNPTVFIRTQDLDLATSLVRLLNEHGINGFWVTDEEAQKLAQVWRGDAEVWDRGCWWVSNLHRLLRAASTRAVVR